MSNTAIQSARRNTSHPKEKSIYLLGRKITCTTTSLLVSRILDACVRDEKLIIANYNIHSFNLSVQFPWFYDFLQDADIAHCDGLGIIYALRIMGHKISKDYRVSYSLLMPKLLEKSNENELSIYLLGSKSENVQMALKNIKGSHPNIRVLGHHGYFQVSNQAQSKRIISEINKFGTNILIVGMGMPLQEYWVKSHQKDLEVNSILLGGAVIDRLAGVVSECPKFLSANGLEWVYRLFKEPKRLLARYVIGNPAFLLQVILARFLRISVK